MLQFPVTGGTTEGVPVLSSKAKIRNAVRGMLVSVVLAAGLLALVQIEPPTEDLPITWRKPGITQHNTWRRMYEATVGVVKKAKPLVLTDQLRQLMSEDELGLGNPFANLSSEDALNAIFKSEIKAFERQTLRSPTYRDESGYDLVHYEILHANGTMSNVLAYIDPHEKFQANANASGVPQVREDVVVVMILTPKQDKNEYAVYRGGALEEVRLLIPEEGEAMLAQRLEAGIPFLSVSR